MGIWHFTHKGEISIMLNDKSVLKLFEEYLSDDEDVEVMQTRHGKALMLWNSAAKIGAR